MIRSQFISVSIASALLAAALAASSGPAAAADEPILGAPSPVPHPVKDYLPITLDKNMCLACHKAQAGEKRAKGEIPTSHYLPSGQLAGERFECMLCHAESSNAPTPAPVDPNHPTN